MQLSPQPWDSSISIFRPRRLFTIIIQLHVLVLSSLYKFSFKYLKLVNMHAKFCLSTVKRLPTLHNKSLLNNFTHQILNQSIRFNFLLLTNFPPKIRSHALLLSMSLNNLLQSYQNLHSTHTKLSYSISKNIQRKPEPISNESCSAKRWF